jgi:N-acyl-D-amino-acid deacylase
MLNSKYYRSLNISRRLFAILLSCGLASTIGGCSTMSALPEKVDTIITNGRILDGTGNSWRWDDIAVYQGKIVKVGNLGTMRAETTIDAKKQIVAPGFIDVHAHIEFGLFATPTADNFIYDGVTTVITGNCGGSATNLPAFFARIDKDKTSINVASLVGHNTVRRAVLDLANRAATPTEQSAMESLVAAAMRDGAVGLSTGLIYLPGTYSNTDEVIGLARTAAKYGGLYASHIRNEGNKVSEAINEALNIGRQANLPVQISHFKVGAPANWGRSTETLSLIEAARRDGLEVTIDQYPYTASSTNLGVMLPDWAGADGPEATNARIIKPDTKAKIVTEMLASMRASKRPDFSYAVVARHQTDPKLNGKNIAQINLSRGRSATAENEIETMLEIILAGGAQMVYHTMNEEDVKAIMRYPFNMIGADGGVQDGQGMPHPRSYGTNARVLGKYVREEKVIRLEDAVRRMTSLAAQKFQLKDRGQLREGFAADIVIFDENTVIDKATFENPHQFSVGFSHVLVNGVATITDGKHTGARAGQALRGPGWIGAK